MVYHSDKKLMVCHHCGNTSAHPTECPECHMPTIKFFGLGTKSLEEETLKAFPEARVARLDSDATQDKNSYLETWKKFKNGEIDILIGTQMIAKGLDIEKLSTAGVVLADSSLAQLDYMADERGFQLLTQVAGRAGRHQTQGNVIFQTYQPDRDVILDAQKQSYTDFYTKEIELREELAYPPFASVSRVVSASEHEAQAIEALNLIHEKLYTEFGDHSLVQILGPCPCTITKLKRKYRYHLVFKIKQNPEN